ncbi:MAG TPA: sugar phosphate isomerase/epimerase family protein [Tissierellaceae bacterium]|nr:sugar phosphate isomerase/epimerase family protein [Tissierellaceae bacterium]
MRRIVNCISTIRELDVEDLNAAGCGVELQDFVEPNLSENDMKKLINEYKRSLREIKGIKSMHGPFLDLKPASPDKEIRRVSQIKYRRTLEIAHELDVDYVVFHSQINPYLNQPFLRDLNNRQAAAFWRALMDVTPYKGEVVIENVFEESPYMLRDLIDAIGHERISINLDIGHSNLGYTSLKDWIHVLADRLSYMHVHGNSGFEDQHIVPSDEKLDSLLEILDQEGIDPFLALEYKINNLKEEVQRYRRPHSYIK